MAYANHTTNTTPDPQDDQHVFGPPDPENQVTLQHGFAEAVETEIGEDALKDWHPAFPGSQEKPVDSGAVALGDDPGLAKEDVGLAEMEQDVSAVFEKFGEAGGVEKSEKVTELGEDQGAEQWKESTEAMGKLSIKDLVMLKAPVSMLLDEVSNASSNTTSPNLNLLVSVARLLEDSTVKDSPQAHAILSSTVSSLEGLKAGAAAGLIKRIKFTTKLLSLSDKQFDDVLRTTLKQSGPIAISDDGTLDLPPVAKLGTVHTFMTENVFEANALKSTGGKSVGGRTPYGHVILWLTQLQKLSPQAVHHLTEVRLGAFNIDVVPMMNDAHAMNQLGVAWEKISYATSKIRARTEPDWRNLKDEIEERAQRWNKLNSEEPPPTNKLKRKQPAGDEGGEQKRPKTVPGNFGEVVGDMEGVAGEMAAEEVTDEAGTEGEEDDEDWAGEDLMEMD